MEANPAASQLSPEPKPKTPRTPLFPHKDVVLFEWWLMKTEKGHNGKSLAVGGFTKRGDAVGIFSSSPIIKRHDQCTLQTSDGITLRIQGPMNQTRTTDNGFNLEASTDFLFGFPTTWDNFSEEPPSDQTMLEPQQETAFDPSYQKKTVLLKNWWLRKTEKGGDGSRLAVSGFTEWGKAMRLFDSSPIIKRHDAYTLETADGVTIMIQGFINKTRTLDNGFPPEVCKTFLIGFPTTWTDFSNGYSRDHSSQTETLASASRSAEQFKDSLENMLSGFPVHSKITEAIHKFLARESISNPVHIPLVDRGSHHLPEKSICDNRLPDDESCGANMRDAHKVGKDYEYLEAVRTPVDNESETHEAGCTDGVHTNGAGCQAEDLLVDELPQENSLITDKLNFIQVATLNTCNKCSGHALRKSHHNEGVETCSTGILKDFAVGKDLDKEATAQKKTKFDECSTRRSKKLRLDLSKLENLRGQDQKYAKSSVKPVRRSERLLLPKVGNVHRDFKGYSQFLNETNDCANLVLDGSKTSASQPTDSLVGGSPSSPIFCGEARKFVESSAKSLRKSEILVLPKLGNGLGDFQDYSQFLNQTNNSNHASLAPDGSKTSAASQPNNTIFKGIPSSPTGNIPLPSAGLLSQVNQDGHQHSINTWSRVASNSNSASKFGCFDDFVSTACLGESSNDKKKISSDCLVGLAEGTHEISKPVTRQTVERMVSRGKKKKVNHSDRSRMKVRQNDSRNQPYRTNSKERISFSSASNTSKKSSNLGPIEDKSPRMRKHYKVEKNCTISTYMQQAKDKAYRAARYKTVWVSSYTDVHRTPITRHGNDLSILTPESQNLKRSRSGRLLVPRLDCTTRIIYEADGSIAGTANVDGSIAGTGSVVMQNVVK